MNSTDALKPPPVGFKLHAPAPGTVLIEFVNERRSCLVIFLGIWMAGWTVGCVFLLSQLLAGQPLAPNEPGDFMSTLSGSWLFAAPFLLAEVGVGLLFLWLLRGRTELLLHEDCLMLRRSLFSYQHETRVSRSAVTRVMQVKDGGEGDDSFPTWGLKMEHARGETIRLLWRQPIERSDWLGPLVAEWARKPFEPSAQRE